MDTLTLAQLDDLAEGNIFDSDGESYFDFDLLEGRRLIEYARERVARECCVALLLPTEIMNLDCGLVDFEATASDEGGAVARGQGDTATEAWLALGDALEKR
jgi:hypothetical protein